MSQHNIETHSPQGGESTPDTADSTKVFKFDSIDTALADLKAGRCVVVVDDENREMKAI